MTIGPQKTDKILFFQQRSAQTFTVLFDLILMKIDVTATVIILLLMAREVQQSPDGSRESVRGSKVPTRS